MIPIITPRVVFTGNVDGICGEISWLLIFVQNIYSLQTGLWVCWGLVDQRFRFDDCWAIHLRKSY